MSKILSIKKKIIPPSYPDVDNDFGTNLTTGEGQHTIIKYLQDKYNNGHNIHVARVGNLIQYSIKSALRDLVNVFDIPPIENFAITKILNEHISLEENIRRNPKIRAYFEKYPELAKYAPMMVGVASNLGIHAGGVVISDRQYPLNRYAPLQRPDEEGLAGTVWTKKEVENVGLVKYDILGVKALTQIDLCKKLIGRDKPYGDTYEDYPEEQYVFDEVRDGLKHKNIFQFETSLGKKCFADIPFQSINDVSNASGLIRILGSEDGRALYAKYKTNSTKAMKGDDLYWKKELRKDIKEDRNYEVCLRVLNSTYGIMIYQEQLAQFIYEISGGEWSFNHGNDVRKKLEKLGDRWGIAHYLDDENDIRKWHEEMMDILGKCFIQYLGKDGPDSDNQVMQDFINCNIRKKNGKQFLPIPDYGILNWFIVSSTYLFSVLHSTAYSITSYNQMYQKVYYPQEFWTAALTVLPKEKIGDTIATIQSETELKILPPDVNNSHADFTMEGEDSIRYGLQSIKSLDKIAGKIIYERKKNGEYKDEIDFCKRLNPSKTVTLALLHAGAFSTFGEKKNVYKNLVQHDSKYDVSISFAETQMIKREMEVIQTNLMHVHPMVKKAKKMFGVDDISKNSSRKCVVFVVKNEIKKSKNGNAYQFMKTVCAKENTQYNIFSWQTKHVYESGNYYEFSVYRNDKDFYTVR